MLPQLLRPLTDEGTRQLGFCPVNEGSAAGTSLFPCHREGTGSASLPWPQRPKSPAKEPETAIRQNDLAYSRSNGLVTVRALTLAEKRPMRVDMLMRTR